MPGGNIAIPGLDNNDEFAASGGGGNPFGSIDPNMSMSQPPPLLDDFGGKQPDEVVAVVLPKALEDVFAFKDQLADQLGRTDGEMPAEVGRPDEMSMPKANAGVISGELGDAFGDEVEG